MAAMVFFFLFNFLLIRRGQAEQCGSQAGGALCADSLCCSQYGWCGSTAAYCDTAQGCQSQCSTSASGVASIISSSVFDDFFPSRNSFYTYDSFISAANSFGGFGTSGSSDDQKRELAAFFANVQQETGGLTEIEETNDRSAHCDSRYSCPNGKSYYGRGPLQLSWNYNYQAAGDYLQLDLINNPDLLAQDATASFKASVWFWMQSPSSSSSCHQAMIGGQGFGQTIKIINYSYECGKGTETAQASNRISYYKSFCSKLGVDPGSNLSCA